MLRCRTEWGAERSTSMVKEGACVKPPPWLGPLDLGRDGVQRVLGDLEYAVLQVLWEGPAHTAREVENRVRPHRNINTIMSTLNRLVRKRLIARDPGTPARFWPCLSHDELAAQVRMWIGRVFLDEMEALSVPQFLGSRSGTDGETARRLVDLAHRIAHEAQDGSV